MSNDGHREAVTDEILAALRTKPDAINIIADLLGVREMGPADHIRTKHEVRDFVKTGDIAAGRAVVQHAKARRELWARKNGK